MLRIQFDCLLKRSDRLGQTLGFSTTKTLAETLERSKADVVLHTTNSYFDLFKPQIMEILDAGLDIVSTSEELSFPWRFNKEQADEIAAAAEKAGKTVLGTGVNPGFLMDTLPLNLSSICQRVGLAGLRPRCLTPVDGSCRLRTN